MSKATNGHPQGLGPDAIHPCFNVSLRMPGAPAASEAAVAEGGACAANTDAGGALLTVEDYEAAEAAEDERNHTSAHQLENWSSRLKV